MMSRRLIHPATLGSVIAPRDAITWPLLVVFACCLLAIGCRPVAKATSETKSKEPLTLVAVADARIERLAKVISVPTTITGYDESPILPKVDGYISKIRVDIGDSVKKGAILIQLSVPEMKAEVNRAKSVVTQTLAQIDVYLAQLRSAQANHAQQQAMVELRQSEFARNKRLVDSGAIERQKIEEATFALASAKATLTSFESQIAVAQAQLESSRHKNRVAEAELKQASVLSRYQLITAPFAGVITSRNVDLGTYVRPANRGGDNKPLLTIASVVKMRAVIHLGMDQATDISVGDEAVVSVQDVPGEEFSGSVSRYSRAYDEGSRMMRVEIDLDNSISDQTGEYLLRPGGYGTAVITTRKQRAVVVPEKAVRNVQGTHYVTVVDPDGTCRERPVQTLFETNGLVGIASGLRKGERVIAEKSSQVRSGTRLAAQAMTKVY